MIRRGTAGGRPALTLIEVLVALAIFLLSFAAITRLVTFAGQRALDARRTEEAARLARSKFAEVFAGVVPLQSSDDSPFDEDPDYTWSLTADEGTLSELWVVTVTVKRKGDDGPGFTLRQFMLDPTLRGSTQDSVMITGSTSSPTGSGTSSGSSPSQAGAATAGKSGKSGAAAGAARLPRRIAPKERRRVDPPQPTAGSMPSKSNSSASKR